MQGEALPFLLFSKGYKMFKLLKSIRANYIMMALVVIGALLVLFTGLNTQDERKSKASNNKPQRVVSLSVSTDEMLLALLGKQRLIAVSPWSDMEAVSCISQEVKDIPYRAQSRNAEAILSLNADLIVAPDYTKAEIIQTLRDSGAKVFVCKTPHSMLEIKEVLRELGTLVGEPAEAEKLIAKMEQRLKFIDEQVKKIPASERVEVLRVQDNGAYYAPHTSFMEVCRLAGMKDATEKLQYDYTCTLSQEEIVLLDPDVFVIENWNYDGRHDAKELSRGVLSNKAYSETKAYKTQRAVLLPANHLLTVSQYMVEAVEDMAVAVYPKYVKRQR